MAPQHLPSLPLGRRIFPACLSGRLLLVLGAVAVGQGCSDKDWHAETYPAEGRITVNGAPPGGAIVELHATGERPDVRNSRPWAIVQDDGSYHLSTYKPGDGAPRGEYALTVRWPPDASKPSLADRLGNAYARPEQSQWRVTISEGENVLPPVDITGAKVLPIDRATTAAPVLSGPPMGN